MMGKIAPDQSEITITDVNQDRYLRIRLSLLDENGELTNEEYETAIGEVAPGPDYLAIAEQTTLDAPFAGDSPFASQMSPILWALPLISLPFVIFFIRRSRQKKS